MNHIDLFYETAMAFRKLKVCLMLTYHAQAISLLFVKFNLCASCYSLIMQSVFLVALFLRTDMINLLLLYLNFVLLWFSV